MKVEYLVIRMYLIFITILVCFQPTAFTSSETYTNHVTVEVPSYLFIEGDRKDLDFKFFDYRSGSETETRTVAYTVMGNGMMQSEGAPAMTVRLDGMFPDIDFKARVESYAKQGGNTELGAVVPDFVTVKDSDTVLARKANSTGDGKLLRGQLQVSYKAVAAASLQAGEYAQGLTLTLTDV